MSLAVQVVITVVLGIVIAALLGGSIAGLITEKDRTSKWGGVATAVILIACLSIGIVAVWN